MNTGRLGACPRLVLILLSKRPDIALGHLERFSQSFAVRIRVRCAVDAAASIRLSPAGNRRGYAFAFHAFIDRAVVIIRAVKGSRYAPAADARISRTGIVIDALVIGQAAAQQAIRQELAGLDGAFDRVAAVSDAFVVEARRLDGTFKTAVRRLAAELVEAITQDFAGHQPTMIFSTAPLDALFIGPLG